MRKTKVKEKVLNTLRQRTLDILKANDYENQEKCVSYVEK